MAKVSLIMEQLKQARDQAERHLKGLDAALTAFGAVYAGGRPIRKRRTMSLAGRKRIAAAQRARWAKVRAGKK
jgi:hypothetical protein